MTSTAFSFSNNFWQLHGYSRARLHGSQIGAARMMLPECVIRIMDHASSGSESRIVAVSWFEQRQYWKCFCASLAPGSARTRSQHAWEQFTIFSNRSIAWNVYILRWPVIACVHSYLALQTSRAAFRASCLPVVVGQCRGTTYRPTQFVPFGGASWPVDRRRHA